MIWDLPGSNPQGSRVQLQGSVAAGSWTGGRSFFGFSLVEIMCAVGLSLLIIGILGFVVTAVTRHARESMEMITINQRAEALLSRLEADVLQGFIPDGAKVGARVWVGESSTDASGWAAVVRDLKPSDLEVLEESQWVDEVEGSSWGREGVVWMGFSNEDTPGGDMSGSQGPSLFVWRIVRMASHPEGSGTATIYALTRYSPGERATFEGGYDLGPESLWMQEGHEGMWTPDLSSVAGVHVIDFGIRLWGSRPGSAEPVLLFPALESRVAEGWAYGWGRPQELGSSPSHFEFRVRVLSDQGARLLNGIESGRLNADWRETALSHSREFVRRVPVIVR